MRVGDGEAEGSIAGHDGGVALGDVNLGDRVLDGLAVSQLGQVAPCVLPLVGGAQLDGLARYLAVGEQLHPHRRGTQAVGVVDVVPDLLHVDGGILGLVLVRQLIRERALLAGVLGHLAGVALRHVDLGDRVLDVLAVLFRVKAGPLVAPFAGRVQLDRTARCHAVGAQLHLHRCGAQAILVVRVVPGLRHLH